MWAFLIRKPASVAVLPKLVTSDQLKYLQRLSSIYRAKCSIGAGDLYEDSNFNFCPRTRSTD